MSATVISLPAMKYKLYVSRENSVKHAGDLIIASCSGGIENKMTKKKSACRVTVETNCCTSITSVTIKRSRSICSECLK